MYVYCVFIYLCVFCVCSCSWSTKRPWDPPPQTPSESYWVNWEESLHWRSCWVSLPAWHAPQPRPSCTNYVGLLTITGHLYKLRRTTNYHRSPVQTT